MVKYTFAICTFNRASILPECLRVILNQISDDPQFDLLVVDNNSFDNTHKVVCDFQEKYQKLYYVKESKQGLSQARNRAIKEAKGEWVIYIDDDAKIAMDYCKTFLSIMRKYNFDCIGGIFYAWYPYGRPKWIPDNFGNMDRLRKNFGLINGSSGWLCGGNMAIKKSAWQAVGGYDPNFGMNGGRIGYGEEDHLQQRLFDRGFKIAFAPELKMDHAVIQHKLRWQWHLKSSFMQGKVGVQLNGNSNLFLLTFRLFKTTLGLLFKRGPIAIWKLLNYKKYYWQNAVLDMCKPIAKALGALSFGTSKKG